MDEIRVCPNCSAANQIDATLCKRCGMTFVPLLTARLTPNVPSYMLQPVAPDHERFVSQLQRDGLLLVVAGKDQPIFLKKSNVITLGREVRGETAPWVDFTPHNAFHLGVSRQHGVIEVSRGRYFFRDLESTNGTWLNDVKLVPHRAYALQTGDLIRMGQLGFYIYFNTEYAPIVGCVITDATTPMIELTPEYLMTRIGPYLTTLSELNTMVDMILERTQFIFAIRSAYVDTNTNELRLDFRMSDDLAQFLEEQVSVWKKQHQPEIKRVWELEQNLNWLSTDSQEQPAAADYAESKNKLQAPLTELVHQFLDGLNPHLSDPIKELHLKHLLPVFYRLVHSPLQLARQPVSEVQT
jgi:FHA domain